MFRIWIDRTNGDMANAALDNIIDAGGGSSPGGAGLQRNVENGAGRDRIGHFAQAIYLGMVSSRLAMIAAR